MHEDDFAQMYMLADYLNSTRGLPPATRANELPPQPTQWEVYLTKELKRPFTARPSLKDMERAAGVQGIKVEYRTMQAPVDTWTRGGPILGPRPDVVAKFAQHLEREGYADDEK